MLISHQKPHFYSVSYVTARVPSAYVMYKFYTFPDHDSAIVPASSSPVFSDVKHFPVSMDCHLDEHLSNEVGVWGTCMHLD